MNRFVFELKLSWAGFYGNLLEWIPRIHVFVSKAPSIKLHWICMELSLWCGILKNIGKGFYLTPCFVFKHLDKKFKEKYDFQLSWLGISYRKFIGERDKYETSIIEELKNPFKFDSDYLTISLKDYNQFLAECYEAEDEFWKEVYEDMEVDKAINEEKENF